MPYPILVETQDASSAFGLCVGVHPFFQKGSQHRQVFLLYLRTLWQVVFSNPDIIVPSWEVIEQIPIPVKSE